MAEAFTGIETDLTLLEWSDLNRPLMQRLSLEAPGTYAHTIAIANLADARLPSDRRQRASRTRGSLLPRHRQNRATTILRRESGERAKSPRRVEARRERPDHSESRAEGLELAAEYKLPRALRAFITEHHGTGTITYFLDKARQRAAGAGPLDAAEYRVSRTDPADRGDGRRHAGGRRRSGNARAQRADRRKDSRCRRAHRAATRGAGTARRRAAHFAPARNDQGGVHARSRRHVSQPYRLSGGGGGITSEFASA